MHKTFPQTPYNREYPSFRHRRTNRYDRYVRQAGPTTVAAQAQKMKGK